MKTKFKLIATATVLALASMSASATISTTSSATTSPDLLFVAYDDNTGATYVRDLGSVNQLSTSQTFNTPTGSTYFSSLFANTAYGDLQWNVIAFDTTNEVVYDSGEAVPTQKLNAAGSIANSEISALGGVTQLDSTQNTYSKGNGEYVGPSSTASTAQANGYQLINAATFGHPFMASGQGIGDNLNFFQITNSGAVSQLYVNSTLTQVDPNNEAGGYFTLTDANGDLTWTAGATVSSVPLPGAALLFVPGLMAMFGIGRRNKKFVA